MKLKDVFISYEEFKRGRYENKPLLFEVINKEYESNDFLSIDIGNEDAMDAKKIFNEYEKAYYAEINIIIRLFKNMNSFIYKSTFKRGKNIKKSIIIYSYKMKNDERHSIQMVYFIKFQFRNSNMQFAKDIYNDDEYFKYIINRFKEHIVFLHKSNKEHLQ